MSRAESELDSIARDLRTVADQVYTEVYDEAVFRDKIRRLADDVESVKALIRQDSR